MRGLRSTLVLLVIAVGLGAYIYFVERHRDPASEDPPSEQLLELEADDVTGLQVTANDGSVTELRHDEDGWQVVAPVQATADDTTASSIASSLASLEVRRVVDEGPVDLSPFGLDQASLDVGFSTTEEATRHLLVGDQTPTGSDRYAKLSDSDRVFLIASYLSGTFDKTTFDLRDKTILEFERTDLDTLEITSPDRSITLSKDGDDWRLAEPWDVGADFGTVEGLLGSLSSGRMQSIVSEEADDLESFGLAEPHVTIAVSAGSATARLSVGDETPDGWRYAHDAASPLVFTVDGALVATLERDAGEYRRKDLFGFRPFSASRLEVQQADETVVFEKRDAPTDDGEDTWHQLEPGAGDVDRDKVEELLRLLSGLRAESFVSSRADAGLDDERVVATVSARYGDDDTEETVVIWRSGDDTFGVPEGEPGAARIDGQAFDDAIDALEAAQSEQG
jgi:hypothetical protein